MSRKKERFILSDEQRQAHPPCQYFGECGGCRYQDVEYPLQVQAKSQWLMELFGQVVEVVPSPIAYGYRNRMDFVYAFGKLGLRRRGTYKWVVDIESCPLMSENANRLLTEIRPLLAQQNIPCYNYIRHEGYLRYVVLRSTALGETQVSFVTSRESPEILPVIEAIAPQATSTIWMQNDGIADLSFGKVLRHWGAPVLQEKIHSHLYQMGPNSFFQNNARLIGRVIEDIRAQASGRVLDLYCGVGCLGIAVADRADSVLGIESVEESIGYATENARLNSVSHIEFQCAPVRDWLQQSASERAGHFHTIIADPPREGLTPRVARYLNELAPRHILYVSCNPSNLQQEIALFENYSLVSLRGYDLFPQTPQVEVLAHLERIK